MSHRLKGPLPDPKNKSNELAEREREEKCTQDANRIQDLIETLKSKEVRNDWKNQTAEILEQLLPICSVVVTISGCFYPLAGTAASIIESIGRFALKFMHFNQCLLDLLTQTVKLFEPLNAIIKTNREFESQTPKTIDAKSPDIKTANNKPSEIKTIDIKSQVEDRNWVELYDTCLNRLRDLWTDIISKIAPNPTSKMVKTSIWAPFEEWKEALENIHADFIKISNFHSVEVLMNTYQLTKDLGRNIDRLKDLVETNSNQLYQYLEIDSHNPYVGYSPSESRKVLNWLLGEAKDVFPSLDANSITVKSGQQAPPQPKAAGPRAKKILILSGDSSCGKSWALEGLINHLKDKKFRVFSYFRDNSDTRPFDVAHITKALLYRYLSHNSNQAEFFGQLKQGDGKLPESQINHKFIWSKIAQSLALRPGNIVFAIDYAKKNKSSFTSEDWKSISDIIKPFLSSDTRFIFTTRRFPQETPNIEALNQLAVVVDVASKNKQERKAFIKGKWDELKKVGKSLSEAKQKEFRHLLGENSKGDYSKITDFFNMLHKSPYFNQERIESAIRDLGGNRLKIVDTMRNCSHTNRMSDVKFMIAWLTCAFVPSLKVTTFALFRSLTPTQSLQSNTAISERLKEYDLIFQHDPDSDCLTWQVGASCQSFTLADSFRQTKIPCNAAMYDMHDKLILGIKEAFKTDPHPASLIEKAVNEAFNDPTIRNDHDDNLRIAVYCLRVLTRLYDSKQNLRPRFRRGKNAMEHQGFDGEDERFAITYAVASLAEHMKRVKLYRCHPQLRRQAGMLLTCLFLCGERGSNLAFGSNSKNMSYEYWHSSHGPALKNMRSFFVTSEDGVKVLSAWAKDSEIRTGVEELCAAIKPPPSSITDTAVRAKANAQDSTPASSLLPSIHNASNLAHILTGSDSNAPEESKPPIPCVESVETQAELRNSVKRLHHVPVASIHRLWDSLRDPNLPYSEKYKSLLGPIAKVLANTLFYQSGNSEREVQTCAWFLLGYISESEGQAYLASDVGLPDTFLMQPHERRGTVGSHYQECTSLSDTEVFNLARWACRQPQLLLDTIKQLAQSPADSDVNTPPSQLSSSQSQLIEGMVSLRDAFRCQSSSNAKMGSLEASSDIKDTTALSSIGAGTAAVSTLRSPRGKQAVKQMLPPIVTLSKFCQSKTHWPQSHCSYEEIKLWMTNTIAGGIEKLPPSALLQGMEQFLWYCVFIPYSDSGSTQGPSLSPESIKRCADYILDRWCTVSAARRLLLIPQSEMSVRIHDDMFQKINRKWAHDQSEKTKEQWLSRADDFVYGILGQEHLRPRLVKLCIGNKDARDVIETLVRHVFDKSNMYGMEVRLKASIGFASIIGLYSNTLSTMKDSVNWLFAALDPKSDLLQKSQKLAKYLKAQRHDNVDLVLKLLTRISRYMDTRSNGEQYAASSFNKLKATLRSVCCDDHAEVMVATNAFHIDPKNDTAFYPKPTEVFITKRLSNLGGPGTQSPVRQTRLLADILLSYGSPFATDAAILYLRKISPTHTPQEVRASFSGSNGSQKACSIREFLLQFHQLPSLRSLPDGLFIDEVEISLKPPGDESHDRHPDLDAEGQSNFNGDDSSDDESAPIEEIRPKSKDTTGHPYPQASRIAEVAVRKDASQAVVPVERAPQDSTGDTNAPEEKHPQDDLKEDPPAYEALETWLKARLLACCVLCNKQLFDSEPSQSTKIYMCQHCGSSTIICSDCKSPNTKSIASIPCFDYDQWVELEPYLSSNSEDEVMKRLLYQATTDIWPMRSGSGKREPIKYQHLNRNINRPAKARSEKGPPKRNMADWHLDAQNKFWEVSVHAKRIKSRRKWSTYKAQVKTIPI
ncbi:hypothetical protein HOO65_070053 [Ceratocystis lukuohia]|uniref:Nephrocystin 3-like N-terminal domain-containing protein n=1 Tax=Ceratocystis lukuohia TaxID=2019550 RepID=A0ABR4MBD4_9PEZI